MRSFVAIPVTEDITDTFAVLYQRIGVGRAVPPENLHLTLAFLDDQPEDDLENLHHALQEIRQQSFALSFRGVGQFGQSLHLAAESNPALDHLQGQIRKCARRAGIALPRRRFHPHITFARLRRDTALTLDHRDVIFQCPDMSVTQFALYSSTLRPTGARHECLASYPCSLAD
ncbi:MAG: RNA 2',3'-cyclic phosphodiesterase [Ruegeria sp.]